MAFPFLSPTTGKGETMRDLLGERAREAERIKHHAMQENITLRTNSSKTHRESRNKPQLDRLQLATTIPSHSEPTSCRSQNPTHIPQRPHHAWQSYFRPKIKSEKGHAQRSQWEFEFDISITDTQGKQ
jgi:hypothetical protein